MLRLSGRRIVVTGAAGAIGVAAVARMRREGAVVVGIDLRAADGVVTADVADPAQAREAVSRAAALMGGIDTLVNNAGIGAPQDAGALPDAEARRIVDVNFFGAWNATAAAMPHLLRGRGHVVNVISGLAVVDLPFAAAYTASKCALDGYARVLRQEYHGRITVTNVYPGYIRTPIHDRAVELGTSLDGLVRAERIGDAAEALVVACARRPRRLALTRRSAVELWVARHLPDLVASVVRARARAAWARRPPPRFLRGPAEEAADR
jgi:NAD(P)-dependent dehydrogenase (short-subunit alcohol dehydrogenase family)